MQHFYIAAKGILGLKTNIKDFGWSYGHSMPEGTESEYEACEVKIRLVLEDFNDDHLLESLGKYHYFNGSPNGDRLYYTRKLAMNQYLRLKLEDVLSGEPTITVNRNYYRLITHRIMNLHSPAYIMTDLVTLLLLKKGYAPVHCSAFKKDGSTVAVFGPPNTGKTLSTILACMNHGASFIAEDLAITDGRSIYAVPWTSSFRYYAMTEQSMGAKLKGRLTKVIPPLEYLSFGKADPITDYVAAGTLLDCETVTHLALLERGANSTAPQSEKEALRKIVNLNRNEFNYLRAPALIAYEFFNPGLAIDRGMEKEKEILAALVKNSTKCISVKKTDATKYVDVLLDELQTDRSFSLPHSLTVN